MPNIRNVIHLLPARTRAQLLASIPHLTPSRLNLGTRAAEHAKKKATNRAQGINSLLRLANEVGTVNQVFPNTVRENLRGKLGMTRPQMNKLIGILRSGIAFYNVPAVRRMRPGFKGGPLFVNIGLGHSNTKMNERFMRSLVHRVKTIPNLRNRYNFSWTQKVMTPKNILHNTGPGSYTTHTRQGNTVRLLWHRLPAFQAHGRKPPTNIRNVSKSRARLL
jgi:hypothetical protein